MEVILEKGQLKYEVKKEKVGVGSERGTVVQQRMVITDCRSRSLQNFFEAKAGVIENDPISNIKSNPRRVFFSSKNSSFYL